MRGGPVRQEPEAKKESGNPLRVAALISCLVEAPKKPPGSLVGDQPTFRFAAAALPRSETRS